MNLDLTKPIPQQATASAAATAAAPATAIPPPSKTPPVFTTTEKAATDHGIKMLVYGGAGVGKTTFCATAPSPLIISAEAGLLSIRRQQGIPVAEVTTIQGVWDVYHWCAANGKQSGIQTLCLDSISEIVEKCLSSHRLKSKDPRQAYGSMADESITLVKAFRDLPGFHVIVTAKQTTGTDPVTGVTKAAPTAPGQQVGPALPYLFDEVFHAYTDKDTTGATYHALRTHAAFNAEAKDRSGVLDEVEYPDATHLINKILST